MKRWLLSGLCILSGSFVVGCGEQVGEGVEVAAPPSQQIPVPDWSCDKHPLPPPSFWGQGLAQPPTIPLRDSHNTWLQLKATHGGSYAYVSTRLCTDCAAPSETQVVIAADVATSRSYYQWTWDPEFPALRIVTATWNEQGANVGAHQSGAKAATVEELYDLCNQQILTADPGKYVFSMSLDEKGLLRSCTYHDRSVANDPGTGITLCRFSFTSP